MFRQILKLCVLITLQVYSAAQATPLLQLDPLSGDISGLPGAMIGWGFSLSNTENNLLVTSAAFQPSTDSGTFTDFISSPDNFVVVGTGTDASTVWTQPFNAASQSGIGSFKIKANAVPGTVLPGQIVLNYDLYTRSPLDPEFNPDTDTISNGNVLAANTKVTIQASAVDDPHFTTFLGQHYDFQAVGEFELARSTAVGNLFQTQVRTRTQEAGTAGYTIISQAAALVGSQRVTFDVDHANDGGSILWIDGHPVSLSLNNPLILEGGSIVEFSPRQYEVLWNSGESLKVANDVVDHLNVTVALSLSDPLESLDGLLAADSCRTCDVLLPISSLAPEVLYGSFADAWRVTDTTSLFDYGACQTTATFTDKTYTFDLDATRYAQQTAAGCPLTLISGQQFDQLALPEPGTTALFSLGLLSLLIVNRHRKSPISSWRRSPRCWKPESVTHYRAVMVK